MASLIQLPMLPKQFYPTASSSSVRAKFAEIRRRYGSLINAVAAVTNVPERILVSFVFIESGGDASAVNKGSGAVGLMQLVPAGASDMLSLEARLGRLGAAEKEVLRRYLGSRLDCLLSMKYFGQPLPCNQRRGVSLTRADLLQPELNLLCGAIYLGILIDQFTENGVIRLDKVIIKYNQGYFKKIKGQTVAEVYASAPTETRNYIAKLAGVNSALALSQLS